MKPTDPGYDHLLKQFITLSCHMARRYGTFVGSSVWRWHKDAKPLCYYENCDYRRDDMTCSHPENPVNISIEDAVMEAL